MQGVQVSSLPVWEIDEITRKMPILREHAIVIKKCTECMFYDKDILAMTMLSRSKSMQTVQSWDRERLLKDPISETNKPECCIKFCDLSSLKNSNK